MKCKDEIKKTLDGLAHEFHTDELAYLALTSKVERQIRDKFAWVLHNKLKDEYNVTREWGPEKEESEEETNREKVDMAIFDKECKNPLAFIEFKAISIFTQLELKRSIDNLEIDMTKMAKLSEKDKHTAERYFIQLVNVLDKELPKDHKCHFAPSHFKRINNINLPWDKEFIKCANNWQSKLLNPDNDRNKYNFEKGEIKAGELFKNSLTIHYWIIWPEGQINSLIL